MAPEYKTNGREARQKQQKSNNSPNFFIPTILSTQYVPSIPPAAAGVAVFALSTVLHWWQHSINAWFCVGSAIGGQMQAIGYLGSILSHNNGHSLILYLMQSVTIIQAPGMVISSNISRLIKALIGEDLSIIRINWLTKLFMVVDALGFLLQTSNAGLSAKESTADIAAQSSLWDSNSCCSRSSQVSSTWTTLLYVLGIAASLIFVRTVFCMAEFAGGTDVLAKKELYRHIYDALLMAGVMATFHFYRPIRERCWQDLREPRKGIRAWESCRMKFELSLD